MHQCLLLTVMMCILGFCSTVIGSGGILPGSGTVKSPYLIQDQTDFDVFSANADYPDIDYWGIGVYVKLMVPLDLSATTYPAAVIAPDTNPDDFSFDGKQYFGFFDGNQQTIRNLKIQTTEGFDCLGLFGYAQNATITNVVLDNPHIISGNNSVYVGSICGYSAESYFENCSSTGGTMSAAAACNDIGGFVGYCKSTQMYDCYAAGDITTGGDNAGGFCGTNTGSAIYTCYATGRVNGKNQVGGFAGYNDQTINNCFARGDTTGTSNVGGFCGDNSGSIIYCYSTGKPSGTENAGGFCAISSGMVDGCFWDTTTSDITTSAGGTGLKTALMQIPAYYQDTGWFFIETFGAAGQWHMPYEKTGYPMLFYQKDIPGDVAGRYGVDLADYLRFSQSWLASSGDAAFNPNCDLEQNTTAGKIVIEDVAILFDHWLSGVH